MSVARRAAVLIVFLSLSYIVSTRTLYDSPSTCSRQDLAGSCMVDRLTDLLSKRVFMVPTTVPVGVFGLCKHRIGSWMCGLPAGGSLRFGAQPFGLVGAASDGYDCVFSVFIFLELIARLGSTVNQPWSPVKEHRSHHPPRSIGTCLGVARISLKTTLVASCVTCPEVRASLPQQGWSTRPTIGCRNVDLMSTLQRPDIGDGLRTEGVRSPRAQESVWRKKNT